MLSEVLVDDDTLLEVEVAVPPLFDDGELVPGMVAALTAPKSPTPAAAANAAPKVSRFSNRIAVSRARERLSV